MLLNIQMAPYNEAPALSILSLGELSWQRRPRPRWQTRRCDPRVSERPSDADAIILIMGHGRAPKSHLSMALPTRGPGQRGPHHRTRLVQGMGHGTMMNFRLKKTVLTCNSNIFNFIPMES